MPDESRDAYRLGQVEKQTRENESRIDSLERWRDLTEQRDAQRERDREEDRRKAEKKSNAAITAVISLAVAIASALAVALISTGHL